MVVLEAESLRKSYGHTVAVADVSLAVKAGELLAVLGPNGAGKSTTLGMLSGLIAPEGGQIRLAGAPANRASSEFKRRLGLVTQELALYDTLSALANVELFGALYGLSGAALRARAQSVLSMVGLSERARERAATFSGGMKRRLNIACALVHDPQVLLLDEPTAGVDPQSRNAIFDNLEQLKREGKALIYTTHYMEEAERLADRIVIIDHGRVVASGTLHELYRHLPAAQSMELECDGAPDADFLLAVAGVKQVQRDGERIVLAIDDLTRVAPGVFGTLAQKGCTVRSVSSGHANLEDVFLALTGRQLRDAP
jgi:ABC-2 type transport system ATP-binding protein